MSSPESRMDLRNRTNTGRMDGKFDEDEPERQLWEGGFSIRSMFGSWFGAALITIAIIAALLFIPVARTNEFAWLAGIGFIALMWVYLFCVFLYRKLGMHYVVTTQRLLHREGILMRKMDRIELIDVDDVNYRQGLIQALLGVGSITISSSDSSHPNLVLFGIGNCRKVADIIDDARRKERRQRGLHFESI